MQICRFCSTCFVLLFILTGCGPKPPEKVVARLSTNRTHLPANAIAVAEITGQFLDETGQPISLDPNQTPLLYIKTGLDLAKIIYQTIDKDASGASRLQARVVATFKPGPVSLAIHGDFAASTEIILNIELDWTDSDKDGFPDVTELTDPLDRRNFSTWFARIAEAQFYKPSDAWQPTQRDCAGLIRFAYREALKKHDPAWFKAVPLPMPTSIADIKKYNYPAVPLVGEKTFRVNDLPLEPGRIDSIFTNFVESQYILHYNCVPLSKKWVDCQTGDLAFFFHFDDPDMPYHGMIVLKEESDPAQEFLVYHTGPDGQNPGEVRKIARTTLNQHPDERWHLNEANPYFLGYFRWKIIH